LSRTTLSCLLRVGVLLLGIIRALPTFKFGHSTPVAANMYGAMRKILF
jgi:hypothetical protein